jgi:hypothetical protein
VVEVELMPSLVGGDTETVCGKLKIWKGFLKPNFELGPKRLTGLGAGSTGSSDVVLISRRELTALWCLFFVHRYPLWKGFPCGFRANENMLTDFNLWVSVHASQGHPVDFALVYTTQG